MRTRSSETTAKQRPARTRYVHDSAGRHQLATLRWLPSCCHSVEPPLTPPSAAMLSAHYFTRNMILSQPGAWSVEPSGLRSAPWNSCTESPRVPSCRWCSGEPGEVREGFDGWRRPHPEQPFGGPDGCRTRQHGGSGRASGLGCPQRAWPRGASRAREDRPRRRL